MTSNKKIINDVFSLAFPIAGLNLITVLIPISIGLMLSQIGEAAFAAGALITVIQSSLIIICTAPLFAISPIVARLNAANKCYKIGNIIQQSYLLSILLAIPAILTIIFIKPILFKFGQPTKIIELVSLYFKSYVWGVPATMLLTCSQQFLLGIKKAKLVSILSGFGLIIIICIGYILAFGKFGVSKFGILGLGYAQTIRSWTTLSILLSILVLKKEYKSYGLFSKRRFNKLLQLTQIFNLGWPISIHAAGEFLMIFVITIFAGKLGQNELIAQQVASQYILLISIIMLALSQSGNILVAQSVGNKQWNNIHIYGYKVIIIGIMLSILVLICFISFPNIMISPYINPADPININLLAIIKPFLMITIFNQIFEAIRTIFTGTLRGLLDTKTPMIIGLIGGWGIGIPLAYLFSNVFGFGINGLAIAQTISLGFCATLLFYRWRITTSKFTFSEKLHEQGAL